MTCGEVTRETVQVACRIRPFNKREQDQAFASKSCIETDYQNTVYLIPPDGNKSKRDGPAFGFDHIYSQQTKQLEVFEEIGEKNIISAVAGYNCTLFTYGQTGSGKTHTMIGQPDNHGLIPRFIIGVFAQLANMQGSQNLDFTIQGNYLEIYFEKIRDLLSEENKEIEPRIHPQRGVYIENLTKIDIKTPDQGLEVLREGSERRQIQKTQMNATSSRSHTIFTLYIEMVFRNEESRSSKINMVDLAGRENEKTTLVKDERLRELVFINKSLFFLSNVIRGLATNKSKNPNFSAFRNSKLTIILADSLVGNCKTTIVCALSPAIDAYDENLATCRFATSVKSITTRTLANLRGVDGKADELEKLTKEIAAYQEMICQSYEDEKKRKDQLAYAETMMKDLEERCKTSKRREKRAKLREEALRQSHAKTLKVAQEKDRELEEVKRKLKDMEEGGVWGSVVTMFNDFLPL